MVESKGTEVWSARRNARMARRLGARVIDWIVYPGAGVGLLFVVLLVLREMGVGIAFLGRDQVVLEPVRLSFDTSELVGLSLPWGPVGYYEICAISFVLLVAYEIPLTAARGQTIGKAINRLRIVRVTDGQTPTWGRACLRWSVLYLPIFIPWIGLALVALISISPVFSVHRRGWPDRIARTVVTVQPTCRDKSTSHQEQP